LALAFTGTAHQIEQAFDFGVVGDDFAVLPDVDQVIGVQAVVLVDVDAIVAVARA